jgi:AcrR family transcriptional regulator
MPRDATVPTRTRWGDRPARRQDILDAARRLLEQHGYQGLNIRDVAQGADVSPGTVYTYFAGKEELFAALYTERVELFHAEIAPICAAAATPEELFVGIANCYLDLYRVFGRELDLWAVALDGPSSTVAQPLVQAAAAVMATLQTAFARFAARGGLRLGADDAGLVLPLLWASLHGLADHFTGARHHMHPYTWHELTGFAARTLVAGLSHLAADHDATHAPAPEGDHRR